MNKYPYLKIPLDYICVYNKLAYYLYYYGIDIIKDCQASCKQTNKTIIECWNLFQLAVNCFEKGEIDKANYFIDYIKNNIDRIYNSNVITDYKGANNYFIDENGDKHTCIVCNGWVYETPNFITTYEFVLSGSSVIEDNGKGQSININITSTKTISSESDKETTDIPFDISYNNPDDSNWITYNSFTKVLTIKPNGYEARKATISFIQSESGKQINIDINQEKDTTEYEYYFEYEPKSFEFERTGGSDNLVVTKSCKRELVGGSPTGDEIPVEWNATIDGYGFSYNPFTNEIIAEANDYKERSSKLIINRPELGSSKNIEISITQKAGALTIIYSLQAIVDNNIVDALDGKVIVTVLSTKQGYYGSEAIGEPEQVPFTITSARGFLTGINENGAVWNMSDNISETTREDTLIITQNSAEGKEVRIKIVQQPAVIDYIYNFNTDNDDVRVDALGGTKTLTITSTRQKTVNGKPYGDAIPIDYSSIITGNFSINKNVISIPENQDEEEKSERAIFTQDESNKQFTVNIVQNAASESYEYTFIVAEGTGKVSFPYTSSSKTFNITSKKQKLINGSPSGSEVQVGFNIIIQGDGYSVGATTGQTAEIKISENKTTNIRTGSVRFIQNESNKELPINLEQAAGTSEWRYTLEVTETEISVPSYESKGITRNFTIQSYRKLYINGVYQDQQANVPYNVSSNQSWCQVSNNSTQISVDENLDSARTAVVTITQTETNNNKIINISQVAVSIIEKTSVKAPNITIYYPSTSKTETAEVKKYNYVNNHIIQNEKNGTIKSVSYYGGNTNFSFSKSGLNITVSVRGSFNENFTCTYLMETDYGSAYGQASYIKNNAYLLKDDIKFQNLISNIYLLIPENYISVYQKLITLIINNNKAIKAKPDNVVNKQIIDCWNLFQSAVAAYNLGFEKETDFFINFIDCHINNIIDKYGEIYNETFYLEHPDMIGIKGSEVTIDDIDFYVDNKDGNIYQTINKDETNNT